MRKFTYEDAWYEYMKRGLILLDFEYVNNNTKMTFMNFDGYKASMKLSNLKSGKSPSYFSKLNPYVLENIQRFLDKKCEGVKLLSTEYNGDKDKLLFRCSCGKVFERCWSDLQQNEYTMCWECGHRQIGLKRRLTDEEIIEGYTTIGYKILSSLSDYQGNTTYLLCEDDEGYRGYQCYAHVTAPDHKKFERFSTRSNSPENIIYNINLWAEKNGIKSRCIELIDSERWTKQGARFRCECGNIFETSLPSFRNNKTRCEHCAGSISSIELATKKWLDGNNIEYIQQYTFNDCRNKLPLPFDFYIPSKGILIEVDGQGHYGICYFNQCSREKAEKSYKLTHHNDQIKTQYCKDHNIKLLRIPYWEYPNNNYRNILYANLIED